MKAKLIVEIAQKSSIKKAENRDDQLSVYLLDYCYATLAPLDQYRFLIRFRKNDPLFTGFAAKNTGARC